MPAGRPFGTYKYSPEELFEKTMEYFKHCDETKITNGFGKEITKPKTLTGLAIWLGVDKDYVTDKLKDEKYSRMIKYIRGVVENDIEEGAMTGKYNPTIAAKNLSANFDWTEKQKVDSNVTGELKFTGIDINISKE